VGELIVALLLVAFAIWLIRYVIAPIAGVLLIATLTLSLGYAFFTSIRSFVTSLLNHKSPYTTYVDKSPDAPYGIKRNYFFGPGYHQISITVKEAFALQNSYLSTLKKWKDEHTGYPWYRDMWIWLFYCAAFFCTLVLGFAWMAVFSVLLSIVIFIGMCGFYIYFMSLWAADRLLLMLKSIQSRCPHSKRISIVPAFVCPDCGLEHRKLTPGPYGILERKCVCGNHLATTYFNGRSKYTATCPFCASELAVSDARQYGIQLVGGVSTGKTTFLAAFWHEYLTRLKSVNGISVVATPENAFEELEYWFLNGESSSTTETNANMYSVVHGGADRTPVQMTIYDIAGEAFASLGSDIQQQQFRYCEGIIFVVDPTANPNDAAETISSFIHEFGGLKGKSSLKTSDVPAVVMISKADLYRRDIGLPKIKATHNAKADRYADAEGNISPELTRNGVCREFLEKNGFENAINLIDGKFNNVRYYAVSAMGHPVAPGQKYEPWGVTEPVLWLMRQSGAEFQDVLSALG
jgi:GTPase SAR1 family protein